MITGITFYRRRKMGIFDDGKAAAEKAYGKAESEVDGFFARNKYTVLILSGVAVTLVVLAAL